MVSQLETLRSSFASYFKEAASIYGTDFNVKNARNAMIDIMSDIQTDFKCYDLECNQLKYGEDKFHYTYVFKLQYKTPTQLKYLEIACHFTVYEGKYQPELTAYFDFL